MKNKKDSRIDAILLILAAVCPVVLGIIGVICSTLLLIIYTKTTKKRYHLQRILLTASFVGSFLAFSGALLMLSMQGGGLDSLGGALMYGVAYKIGAVLLTICPLAILLLDNREFIFKPNTLMIVATLAIMGGLYFPLKTALTTTGVTEDIPTVGDFEEELKQRELMTEATDYGLYGVINTEDRAIKLSFEENNTDKYPLYVYAAVDYPWLIYYVNGEIYAVKGIYKTFPFISAEDSEYREEKIIWNYQPFIQSETAEITTYDKDINRFRKGSIVRSVDFNYYSQDMYAENSAFVNIPTIKSRGAKVQQVKRIDKDSL